MNILLYIAIALVAIIVVVAGMRYGTKKKEEQKVAKAKEQAELEEKTEETVRFVGEMLPDRMT